MNMPFEDIQKQRGTVFNLYFVFIFTIFCSFIPNSGAQILAAILFFVLVIFVPLYRHAAPKGSFLESHMAYLNGTIWLGSLFLTIGLIVMSLWLYAEADRTVFSLLFDRINKGSMVSEEEIHGSVDTFVQDNSGLLIKSTLICIGPPALYVLMRILKALGCASGGEKMGWNYD